METRSLGLSVPRCVCVSVCLSMCICVSVLDIYVCLSSHEVHVEVRAELTGMDQFSPSTMWVCELELSSSRVGEQPGTQSISAALIS